jgi:hypothetical protein
LPLLLAALGVYNCLPLLLAALGVYICRHKSLPLRPDWHHTVSNGFDLRRWLLHQVFEAPPLGGVAILIVIAVQVIQRDVQRRAAEATVRNVASARQRWARHPDVAPGDPLAAHIIDAFWV